MQHSFRSTLALCLGAAAGAAGSLCLTPAIADDTPATPPAGSSTTPPATPPAVDKTPTTEPTKPTPPPAKFPITFSGEADSYYQYQTTNPKHGQALSGRIYDFRQGAPVLELVWIDVAKTAPPNGFGGKVSFAVGDAADADHAPSGQGYVGEARFKNIQQAFVTYTHSSGFTVDFGKYLSPYGYDTTEALLNYNFSLNLPTFLVPNYVAGLHVSYPIKSPNLSLQAYVVNTLHHTDTAGVSNDNGQVSYILRASYTTPDGKFNYIPCYGFGKNKLSPYFSAPAPATLTGGFASGNENASIFDNWLTYHLTKATTLAAEYVNRKDRNSGGNYNSNGNAYAAYVRQQLTSKTALALRYSDLQNRTDTVAPNPITSASFHANEVTGTYEIKFSPAITTRFEYRHDHSNNPGVFGYIDGDRVTAPGVQAFRSDQDTLTVAALFSF